MSCFTKELVSELASKLLIGLSEEENKMVLFFLYFNLIFVLI